MLCSHLWHKPYAHKACVLYTHANVDAIVIRSTVCIVDFETI